MMKSTLTLGLSLAAGTYAQQSAWGQCGGTGWTGPTTCVSGYTCSYNNAYYSQCTPGTATTGPAPTTLTTATTKPPTSTQTSSPGGKVKFAGVNIAGFDFGMKTDGTQDASQILTPPSNQMTHFANDDHMNIFRLPAGWQFLLNNNLGGNLDGNNFGKYDNLVQACLNTGAYCIIDIHNYARWNGAIIGQGGPTNAQLANTWSQLATNYKGQSRIIFGIMNEPHDVPSISQWATTVQASVTAIRNAGATSQMILLPGNDWTGAASFVSDGSLAALSQVTNPDGSTTNLIFDIHKYLDSDGSGTHTECITDAISSAWQPLATALRNARRQALVSETGGGNTQSCVTDVCAEIAFFNSNSDVYLGYTAWAAGAWQASWNYELNLVPTQNGNSWTDTLLVSSCLKR